MCKFHEGGTQNGNWLTVKSSMCIQCQTLEDIEKGARRPSLR